MFGFGRKDDRPENPPGPKGGYETGEMLNSMLAALFMGRRMPMPEDKSKTLTGQYTPSPWGQEGPNAPFPLAPAEAELPRYSSDRTYEQDRFMAFLEAKNPYIAQAVTRDENRITPEQAWEILMRGNLKDPQAGYKTQEERLREKRMKEGGHVDSRGNWVPYGPTNYGTGVGP